MRRSGIEGAKHEGMGVVLSSRALVVTTLQWLAAAFEQPGHLKIIEGGPEHFVLQFLILTVLLLGVVGAVRTVRFAVLRLSAS